MFLAVVDQTIVATALPAVAADTGNIARASWVVVSYLIASTVAAPIYGRLGDAFGRRRLMFGARNDLHEQRNREVVQQSKGIRLH